MHGQEGSSVDHSSAAYRCRMPADLLRPNDPRRRPDRHRGLLPAGAGLICRKDRAQDQARPACAQPNPAKSSSPSSKARAKKPKAHPRRKATWSFATGARKRGTKKSSSPPRRFQSVTKVPSLQRMRTGGLPIGPRACRCGSSLCLNRTAHSGSWHRGVRT